MRDNKKEIRKGITIHTIKTNSFKTDLVAVFLTTKLNRENVTKNAMIPMILSKGSKSLESIEEINKNRNGFNWYLSFKTPEPCCNRQIEESSTEKLLNEKQK